MLCDMNHYLTLTLTNGVW